MMMEAAGWSGSGSDVRAVGDAGIHFVVVEVAEGSVVLEGHLRHLVLRVDGHLEDVGS